MITIEIKSLLLNHTTNATHGSAAANNISPNIKLKTNFCIIWSIGIPNSAEQMVLAKNPTNVYATEIIAITPILAITILLFFTGIVTRFLRVSLSCSVKNSEVAITVNIGSNRRKSP